MTSCTMPPARSTRPLKNSTIRLMMPVKNCRPKDAVFCTRWPAVSKSEKKTSKTDLTRSVRDDTMDDMAAVGADV